MAVVISCVADDKSLKSGGKEVFVRGGVRHDNRCFSRNLVVVREARHWREPYQWSGVTWYYYLLCPPGPGGRHTLVEPEAKREVGTNCEEVK